MIIYKFILITGFWEGIYIRFIMIIYNDYL